MRRDRRLGFSGKRWPQLVSELDAFVDLLAAEGVRSYLEIGALYGDTFHHIGMSLPKGAHLVAADLPGWKRGQPIGRHGGSGEYLKAAARDLKKRGREAHIIFGDSHDAETIAEVSKHAPFDAIMIDGDHTPKGAMADWQDYGQMGRIVAFHDIAGIPDVTKVWETVRKGNRWKEIISPDRQGGIGVIWNE
jgi:predicted O-methyltransferase YrrM